MSSFGRSGTPRRSARIQARQAARVRRGMDSETKELCFWVAWDFICDVLPSLLEILIDCLASSDNS